MAATAQLRTAGAVLNWYNEQPQAAWKLYRFSVMPRNITGAYDGKDKDEGYQKLQSELALISSDDYNNFVLGIFNDKDKEKATPALNKVFVVNEAPVGMIAGYGVTLCVQNDWQKWTTRTKKKKKKSQRRLLAY